jgi:hypothetical protein
MSTFRQNARSIRGKGARTARSCSPKTVITRRCLPTSYMPSVRLKWRSRTSRGRLSTALARYWPRRAKAIASGSRSVAKIRIVHDSASSPRRSETRIAME